MVQLETRREVEREPEQREIATQLTRLKQRIHDGQVCQRLSSPVSSVYQTYTVTEPGVWRWGVHENPDLPEAFHKRRMHEFANLD